MSGPSELELAETAKLKAETKLAKVRVYRERFELNSRIARSVEESALTNFDNHYYYFNTAVNRDTVQRCRGHIQAWMRLADGPVDMTIDFNSGGGSLLSGLDLFGVMREASNAGHKVTTIISGIAGSMAGILVQAGDHRQMRADSWLHMHEVSSGYWGDSSGFMDEAKAIDLMNRRTAEIFARRSGKDVSWVLSMIERREVYLTAEDALNVGFIDEIIGRQ